MADIYTVYIYTAVTTVKVLLKLLDGPKVKSVICHHDNKLTTLCLFQVKLCINGSCYK